MLVCPHTNCRMQTLHLSLMSALRLCLALRLSGLGLGATPSQFVTTAPLTVHFLLYSFSSHHFETLL